MDLSMNEDCTMEVVMKNIYTSCDPENTNSVPVLKLVEFITPYMLEDLSALESLRCSLDPENNNACVTSEKFYEVMNEWIRKIANTSDEDSDFNRTPSVLEGLDEKQLPYIQSTPRASFGQKLLNCEGLLNLSNVSAYSLSTSTQTNENSTVGQEKTILEEEIKRLEHKLNKVSSEMILVKLQLTATEEQNDILQADLDRCKTRLHSEQQIIEHLQNDKRCNDELRDELNSSKKQIEQLNKKVLLYEKDNHHLLSVIKQAEHENAKLEEKCEELSRREQEAKKGIINIKMELELKDQEVTTILKVNDELKNKLNQQRDIIDQLTNENELLEHQKNNLEKALRDDLSARRDSLVYQYKTCLADSSSLLNIGTIPVCSSPSSKVSSSSGTNVIDKLSPPKSPALGSRILPLVRKESLPQTILKNNTPKQLLDLSVPLDLQNYPVLNPTHAGNSLSSLTSSHSVPTMCYIERSNVQDQSSEEECYFKTQDTDFKNPSRNSLHAEISQVVQEGNFTNNFSLLSFENNEKLIEVEEANNFKDIIGVYKDEVNQLSIKNDSIQARLENVNQDNDKYHEQVKELKDKLCILEQDFNNLLIEKKEKEMNFEQIQTDKNKLETEVNQLKHKISELAEQNNNLSDKEKSMICTLEMKNTVMSELEQNLLELKRQFTSLQIENIAKEKELFSKFNFESAYKKIQIELNERNQEVETLSESNVELKQLLARLTVANKELELSLKQAESNLKENEENAKKMMSLNENIELTTTQVQVHLERKNDMINELVELNKKFENNVAKLQEDLQNKITEITELQDCLKADIEIKNIMWRDSKEVKLKLDAETEKNKNLSEEIKEIKEKSEDKYSEMLETYNQEVEKNCKLCDQIYTLKKDLSSTMAKYNEEVDKNHKLYEQVSALKLDIDKIKESQEDYKEKINKKLTDYEDLINRLEHKLEESELENDKLKTALTVMEKKKYTRHLDADTSLSDSSRNRSFEKQKLTIDRLKEKLENKEEQLRREKIKREILEQSLRDKGDIEEKYTKTVLDFEQTQCSYLLEKQELQNIITDLSTKMKIHEEHYVVLENRSKETEDTLSLKLSQVEQHNQRLLIELRNNEFVIKNAHLEIETYKNLFKNADQKAQELSKTISIYLLECNTKEKQIQLLNAELTDRDNKVLSLTSKIADQDMEFASVSNKLTEKKNIITTLEKENKALQEMLSKSDDHKEKELLDIEQKLKNTRRLLQCTEMELNLVEKKLSDSKEQYEAVSNAPTNYENIITNCGGELSRVSDLICNKWNNLLEKEEIYGTLLLLKESEPSEKGGDICALENKIKIAVLLLEFLSTKSPIPMEGEDNGINSLLNMKNNTNQYSQSDVKMIKKFTLRPSRLLVSRHVSPDSPSLGPDSPFVGILETDTSENINSNTSKEIYVNQSPDNHICQTCPYSSDDSYDTANEFSFTKDDIVFASFQDSFPSVSDTFLEDLGLHECSSKQNLTKEETERRFATLAIQIALDSGNIKERLQKQNDRCVQQHEKIFSLIRDVSKRLRDHKCIGAADPISPVFVLLEDIKFLFRDLTQSTQQFGILICENRMLRCWNLVTNYMALLKQDVTNLLSTEPTQTEIDPQAGAVESFGAKFKKNVQNLTNKEEINCSTSVSSSENMGRCRRRYYPSVKNSIKLTFFITFVILVLLISIHWQCRIAAHENQICVLDDFIQKIHIGNPPY